GRAASAASVALRVRLGLLGRSRFEPRVRHAIWRDHFQLVKLEEAAQRPVARPPIRFLARRPGASEAPDAAESEVLLNFLERSACTGLDQVTGRLHASAARTNEGEVFHCDA